MMKISHTGLLMVMGMSLELWCGVSEEIQLVPIINHNQSINELYEFDAYVHRCFINEWRAVEAEP